MNELTSKVIGFAIEVHRHLGPGLLESAYQECLMYEIEKSGLLLKKKKCCQLTTKKLLSKKHIESI